MVPDSDMVPIPGMAASLATFLARPEQRQCEKCAYVVPVYEIKSTIGQGSGSELIQGFYQSKISWKILNRAGRDAD